MEFVADEIGRRVCPKGTIGVFHLVMKSGSDNFRESSILDIMKWLRGDGYHVMVYEPTVKGEYMEFPVEGDLDRSREGCDIILANRMAEELRPVIGKVYCRDIFIQIRIVFVWVAGMPRLTFFCLNFMQGPDDEYLDVSQESICTRGC